MFHVLAHRHNFSKLCSDSVPLPSLFYFQNKANQTEFLFPSDLLASVPGLMVCEASLCLCVLSEGQFYYRFLPRVKTINSSKITSLK